MRPRVESDRQDPGDRGGGADAPVRRFRRRRPCELSHRTRRDFRLPRLERLRKNDNHENDDRAPAGHRRLGQIVRQADGAPTTWRRARTVGYMSQAFSLYSELTVRQNLELHAQLYHLPANEIEPRIKELLERYELKDVADAKPESLPLGVKQRLQLAVAVLHRPPMLILDEPTSGVDPVARDAFWRTLIDLSRNDGVTIFLSTHFMNEAERCDRISLMHQGRVLAVGAPKELVKERGSATLEDAFISYLEEAGGAGKKKEAEAPPQATGRQPSRLRPRRQRPTNKPGHLHRALPGVSIPDGCGLMPGARRWSCCAILSGCAFAFIGPVILMFAMGYGITFDVENLKYAAFDQDQTPAKPQAARKLLGLALFLRTASDRLRRGTGATDAERRTGCRR